MQNKEKDVSKKPNNKLLYYGLIFLAISVFVVSIILIFESKKQNRSNSITNVSDNEDSSDKKPSTITFYTSKNFNYKIEYPQSLKVNELGSGGGYIDFVRFEEGENTSFKGFAIGVSEYGIDDEVKRIRMAFESEGGILAEQKNIIYNDLKTRQLLFKPENLEGMEERLVVIFEAGDYTYSISTVPWQVGEVLSRFQLSSE